MVLEDRVGRVSAVLGGGILQVGQQLALDGGDDLLTASPTPGALSRISGV